MSEGRDGGSREGGERVEVGSKVSEGEMVGVGKKVSERVGTGSKVSEGERVE